MPVIDGYPIANFAITANASEEGGFFGKILQNPGQLGKWLSDKGAVSFSIEKGGNSHLFSQFEEKNVKRVFPFVRNTYRKSPIVSAQFEIEAFCPLGINDLETSSLPVLLLEITCTGQTEAEEFSIFIKPDKAFSNESFQVTVDAVSSRKEGGLAIPVILKPNESKIIRVVLAFYDNEWITANRFESVDEITTYAYRTWNVLRDKTVSFDKAIPATGDKELDTYLRWYMIPGISLTKCTKKEEVLTMGYCELNQRDSYWTSWLHLVLFKDIEKKMIEETITYQQPTGKIPTTILPLIEREDDLDINAFFILRVARYYRLYHNKQELKSYWPKLKNAMDWLIGRDRNGNGLPEQVSFWGDWKDVAGVDGRIYSPFSGLIYLAALKQMIFLGKECGDKESITQYTTAYDKGSTFINKSVNEGGLWNGHYYCQRWRNGTISDKLLQDQTIGILFDVVSKERSQTIISSLNEKSLTKYGICETFPYYPEDFGYATATYHNGAVWPWLSFMDCWARIRIDKREEAVNLIKKVAKADLVDSGDWSPNEHINSLTGENLGFLLQGWNAGLFGLVYFGLLYPDIVL